MAVVWHSDQPESSAVVDSPLPEVATPVESAPTAIGRVGATMDRAELLRLVRAG